MGLTVIAQSGLALQRIVQFLSKADFVHFTAYERDGSKPFILIYKGLWERRRGFKKLSTIAVEGLVDNLG